MTIKEIEERSGMTRANIRFYESEGLLRPERKENGYREYSEDDLATLLRIRLLRSLHIPLDDIRALQSGSMALSAALREQLDALASEQKELERSQTVCREMLDDGAEYASLDARRYLDALSREAPAAVPGDDELPRVRAPFRRFFARSLDAALCSMLWYILLLLTNTNPVQGGNAMRLLGGFVSALIELALEPLFLSKLGTTPGKWVLGLSVTDNDGNRLTYGEAATRLLSLWWYGCGFGVPIYHICRLYKSYEACEKRETLPWEYDSALVLKDEKEWRAYAYVGVRVAMLCVMALAVLLALLPKHRGDITAAEFCENYNDLVDFLDPDQFERLDESGNWVHPETSGVVIYFSNVEGLPPLRFTEQDGFVTGVSFAQTYEDGQYTPPSCNTEMQYLMMSFAGAQKGAIWRLSEIKRAVQGIADNVYRDFDVTACGVRAVCDVEYEGYKHVGAPSGFLFSEEGAQKSYSISFSMSK